MKEITPFALVILLSACSTTTGTGDDQPTRISQPVKAAPSNTATTAPLNSAGSTEKEIPNHVIPPLFCRSEKVDDKIRCDKWKADNKIK